MPQIRLNAECTYLGDVYKFFMFYILLRATQPNQYNPSHILHLLLFQDLSNWTFYIMGPSVLIAPTLGHSRIDLTSIITSALDSQPSMADLPQETNISSSSDTTVASTGQQPEETKHVQNIQFYKFYKIRIIQFI